jgi:dihydrofolate synthase/folylpolyglutamate synthase
VSAALDYLRSFTDYEQRLHVVARADFALDRFRRVLADLGDPQLGRTTVHVTGTKGKGGTVAFVDAALRAHGLRTLRYLSPHLERWNERVALDGADLDDAALDAAVATARPAFESARARAEAPTFFEALTAVAFVAAREAGVDADVLEVGVGGRLDATNVCVPAAVVLTSVDLDHVRLLGDTHDAIAFEKAGIVKPGAPVFVGWGPGEPGFGPVEEAVRRAGTRIVRPGAGLRCETLGLGALADGRLGVRFRGDVDGVAFENVEVSGGGAHQAVNALLAAGAAAAALRSRGIKPDSEKIRRALAATALPARAEVFYGRPTVVLDGAHTPRSVKALAELVAAAFPGRRTVVVGGSTAERDPGPLFAPLRASARRAVFAPLQSPRTASPESAAKAWRELGGDAAVAPDGLGALATAFSAAEAGDVVVVAGSFYLAGELRPVLRERRGGAATFPDKKS